MPARAVSVRESPNQISEGLTLLWADDKNIHSLPLPPEHFVDLERERESSWQGSLSQVNAPSLPYKEMARKATDREIHKTQNWGAHTRSSLDKASAPSEDRNMRLQEPSPRPMLSHSDVFWPTSPLVLFKDVCGPKCHCSVWENIWIGAQKDMSLNLWLLQFSSRGIAQRAWILLPLECDSVDLGWDPGIYIFTHFPCDSARPHFEKYCTAKRKGFLED